MISKLIQSIAIVALVVACSEPEPEWFPAPVVMIEDEYKNIDTNLTAPQLAEKGIVHGTTFNVKFKEHRLKALLGNDYSDVEKGEWIAIIEQAGNLQLAISFGHAATKISCTAGDTLYIQAIPTP